MSSMKKKRIGLYIVLTVITILALIPFWAMFVMSTYRTQDISKAASLIPGSYFFKNLKTVLDSGFLVFYLNSILVAVTFTVSSVLVSAMCGYSMAKFQYRGAALLKTLVVAAIMIPAQLGLIGYVIEMREMHLIGSLWPVILGDVASCFGAFWMTQYISNSIPADVIESGRLDGCSEWGIFFRIVLPYIRPALATLAIIQFVFSWNNYLRPLVVLSDPKLFTLPLGIAALGTRYQTDYGAQICALFLGTMPLIVVFLMGSKTFIQGLTAGAVKE